MQSPDISITEYAAADYEGVWALHQKTVRENDGFVKNLAFHTDFQNIPQTYERFYVARDDSEVVGMVALKRVDALTLEMKRLQVASSHQGTGIGRRLLNEVFAYARATKAQFICLDVSSPQVKARNMYLANGFEISHVEERALGPNKEIFVSTYMRKEL